MVDTTECSDSLASVQTFDLLLNFYSLQVKSNCMKNGKLKQAEMGEKRMQSRTSHMSRRRPGLGTLIFFNGSRFLIRDWNMMPKISFESRKRGLGKYIRCAVIKRALLAGKRDSMQQIVVLKAKATVLTSR